MSAQCAAAGAVFVLTGALAGAAAPPQQAPPPPTQPPAAGQGRGGGQANPARDQRQQAPVGTGMILGKVVNESSNSPVRRARVNLSGAELRGSRTAITDDEGQFVFTLLPPGRYTMTASKAGYVDITYGAKKPGRAGTPIQLAEGQKLEKATLRLPRGGVITGIVLDENGEPAPTTPVRVMRYVMNTGERTLQQAGTDSTDDRGVYRVFGLQPGEYIVSAAPRNAGIGDLRQTVQAEIEAALAQIQAAGAAGGLGGAGRAGQGGQGGGGGGGRAGGGGGGGRGGQPGDLLGGRGQNVLNRIEQMTGRGGAAAAEQGDQQTVGYAPVFYPGTTTPASAAAVTVGTGEERGGVDFQLQLVQTARVDGMVLGLDGAVPAGTQVQLVAADRQSGGPTSANMSSRAGNDGRFSFSNVAPGQYILMARSQVRPAGPEGGPAILGRGAPPPADAGGRGQGGGRGGGGNQPPPQVLWAMTDVSVTGTNLKDLTLTLQTGMTITGRVAFEGTTLLQPNDLTRVRVNLQPVGTQLFDMGGVPPAQVDATGKFTITGVAPGRYALRGNAPAGQGGPGVGAGGAMQTGGTGWSLKSSLAGGRDTLDFPIEMKPNENIVEAVLTFGDRTTEVTGTLQDSLGKPTADYTIIIFPSENRFWVPQSRRIQSIRPGTDGKFNVRGLPPGEYLVVAVTDVERGEWFDPAFLTQLVGAGMRMNLAEGEKKTQDIRLAPSGGGDAR